MKNSRLFPDDPKLTAYAFGELPGDERAEIEAMLAGDSAARAAVDELRVFATELNAALRHEPEPIVAPPTAEGAAAVAGSGSTIEGPQHDAREHDHLATHVNGHRLPEYDTRTPKLLRFPQLYFIISGLAAACFAVLVALHKEKPRGEVRYYQEMTLLPKSDPGTAVTADEPANETTPGATDAVAAIDALPKVEPVRLPSPKPELTFDNSAVALPSAIGNFRLLDEVKSANAVALSSPPSLAHFDAPAYPTTTATQRDTTKRIGELVALRNSVASTDDRSAFVRTGGVYYFPPDDKFVMRVEPLPRFRWPTPVPAHPRADLFSWNPNLGLFDTAPGILKFGNKLPSASGPFGSFDLLPGPVSRQQAHNTESYAYQHDNAFVSPATAPFSTFAIDVDTASYANVRRFIDGGNLPPANAVRVEELVNYFPYHYATATPVADPGAPFVASLEVAAAPWAPTHRLVRIGLQGRDVPVADRPRANLVFLVDVSGSMNAPNKLPLVKQAMRLLVDRLRPDDRVAIVTYAAESGLALPSTEVAKARVIVEALDALTPAGSTNGALGIELAYDIAKANFVKDGINRVILCTDGDFNVGSTGAGELARQVEEKAKSGVALTVLGFGIGNFRDSTLEQLANKGSGNYGYVDTRREAEKLLVQQVNGTLLTVAKDVKVQVDFNPMRVASYRLIGYEDRLLNAGDFNHDATAGGEIGAGHTVTALYEIVPVGAVGHPVGTVPPIDVSRYASSEPVKLASSDPKAAELLAVKIRYQEPNSETSKKLEIPLVDSDARFDDASDDFKFAAAVAEFGMILRDSPHRGKATIGDVIAWAAAGTMKPGDDPGGYRSEFLDLARRTQTLLQ